MEPIDINKDLERILKEGFLDKESRFLKSWRKRWFVLTPYTLYAFKEPKSYTSPTEVIALKSVVSIKTCDEEVSKANSFRIDTGERTFYVAAESLADKELWIGQIGKAMVKLNVKETDFE